MNQELEGDTYKIMYKIEDEIRRKILKWNSKLKRKIRLEPREHVILFIFKT